MTEGETTITVHHTADLAQPVFISHSLADARYAAVFAEELAHHGLRSWFAARDADPRYDYWAQVDQAIQSSGAVVVVMSPALAQSPNVYGEVERARRAGKPVQGLGIADRPGGEHGLGEIVGWVKAFGPEAGGQSLILLFLLADCYGIRINEARPQRFLHNLHYPGEGGEPYYQLPGGPLPSYPPPPEAVQRAPDPPASQPAWAGPPPAPPVHSDAPRPAAYADPLPQIHPSYQPIHGQPGYAPQLQGPRRRGPLFWAMIVGGFMALNLLVAVILVLLGVGD